jgi:glycosyltransferase involved in cell wall biosynthesis
LYGCNKIFLPNFTSFQQVNTTGIELNGENGKRIICLSNLKKPKNHIGLLKGFYSSALFQNGWTLHLIGKDFNDSYSNEVKEFIRIRNLLSYVFIYGVQEDVAPVLRQADIGVLSSTYEGFPLVLLEYGLSGLAVISTNVGFCPEIINLDNGLLFSPENELEFAEKLKMLAQSPEMQFKFANNLKDFVKKKYSKERIIQEAINFYEVI